MPVGAGRCGRPWGGPPARAHFQAPARGAWRGPPGGELGFGGARRDRSVAQPGFRLLRAWPAAPPPRTGLVFLLALKGGPVIKTRFIASCCGQPAPRPRRRGEDAPVALYSSRAIRAHAPGWSGFGSRRLRRREPSARPAAVDRRRSFPRAGIGGPWSVRRLFSSPPEHEAGARGPCDICSLHVASGPWPREEAPRDPCKLWLRESWKRWTGQVVRPRPGHLARVSEGGLLDVLADSPLW